MINSPKDKSAPDERRNFQRIHFQHHLSLQIEKESFECVLLDISLRGALIGKCPIKKLSKDQRCTLLLSLDEMGQNTITMAGTIAHIDHDQVGVHCESIDLDSIVHLRRLLEINLSDPKLLERELKTMLKG